MILAERIRGTMRRRGVVGTGRLLLDRLSPVSSWAEEFVWYHLDLGAEDRLRRRLDTPLTLRRGSVDDMPLIAQLPFDPAVTAMSRQVVDQRLSVGATLWLVTEGTKAVFCCWNFLATAPLSRAAGGEVRLPPKTVLLEDSLSSPDYRGRGVAPSAWSEIANAQKAAGMRRMVTKVAVDNAPSRRAVEKAGFREVARMRLSGPLWRPRVTVAFTDDALDHRWLAELER